MALSWRKRVSLSRALRCQLWGTQTLAVNMGVTVPSSRDRHVGPPGERMLPPLGLPQLRPGHPAVWFLPSRRSRFYFSHSRRWHPGCRLEEGEGQQWTCHTCLLIRTPSRPCLGRGRPQLGALMQPPPNPRGMKESVLWACTCHTCVELGPLGGQLHTGAADALSLFSAPPLPLMGFCPDPCLSFP